MIGEPGHSLQQIVVSMPNKPISMSKLKQIIRLHCQGEGLRAISLATGTSRRTVREYIRKFLSLQLTFQDAEHLDDLKLHDLFFPSEKNRNVPDPNRLDRLQALLPELMKISRQRGMTLQRLWGYYLQKDPFGYSRTRFYLYLRDYGRRCSTTMHLEHKAGEKMFVDYCGNKLSLVDPCSGEVRDVEVFVSILGCSQLTYVEATASQKKEDFITSCRRALEFYGGVPQAIVPDNLKAAVTKSSKYEPLVNEAFQTFSEHYSTVILPARAYKPKDKALVENAVRLVYQRIYTTLTGRVFHSLEELNLAIFAALEIHNNLPLKQGESRRVLFDSEEREALIPLPTLPYELCRIKEHKVMKNGHVSLHEDRHYYSVPYELIGKRVRLIYNSSKVEIYHHFRLVALHVRSYRRNRYTTSPDHLASKHRFLSEWNPEFFLEKAAAISVEVVRFIERLMESKPHPEQGYKACSGVLNLARRVGTERITACCRRALEYDAISYYMLEEIVKKGLDKLSIQQEEPLLPVPSHANLRGKEYYQQQLLHVKPLKNDE